jgi:putative MFS transporter
MGGSSVDAVLQPQEAPVDVAARLDRLPVTRLHAAILLVCAFGLFFDVVEAGLSNALSAVFSARASHVSSTQLSLLLASVFAGGAIGAPLMGWLADHYGRRLALGTALQVLAVTSIIAATSSDITWLTFFRVLSGFALGAYPPLMVAYLSDVLPPARRGSLILIAGAIGFLGAPAVIFLMRWLTPLAPLGFEGWRWTLVIGAIGSAVVGLAFRYLPESPRWLAAVGQEAAAHAGCRRFEQSIRLAMPAAGTARAAPPESTAAAPPAFWSAAGWEYRRRALLLGVLDFLGPWALIGFPLLSGAVLVEKGFRVGDSLLYVGIAMLGPTIGVLIGALIVDRIERRTAIALCGGAMALLGLAFAASDMPLPLMVSGIAFNLIGAIYLSSVSVYSAELFPTRLRASVSSTTWGINRVASVLVPLVLLPLLKTAGALAMFGVIAAALLASITLVLTFGPRGITGRALK